MKINEAVILTDSRVSRSNISSNILPKPLININGKPFIYYLINQLINFKINKITLIDGYGGDHFYKFKKKYQNKFNINLISQPKGYNTGARLLYSIDKLPDKFILLYANNYCGLNLNKIIKNFFKSKKNLQLTAYYKWRSNIKSNMRIDGDKSINLFNPKKKSKNFNYVDIGYTCINKKILNNFKFSKNLSLSSDIIPYLIKKNKACVFKTYNLYSSISEKKNIFKTIEMLSNKKFIFIDRDGVLNVKPRKGFYVTNIDEIVWKKGSLIALKKLKKMKYKTILVTNQAGIGKKIFKKNDLNIIHNYMRNYVRKFKGSIDYIYFCPHHPKDNCFCRKPQPGLFLQAQLDLNLDFSRIKFIGDQTTDFLSARNLGIDFMKLNKKESLARKIDKL